MEEVLSLSQKTLKKFLLSLSVADQHIVSLEAKITFFKNPKAWEADYCVPEDVINMVLEKKFLKERKLLGIKTISDQLFISTCLHSFFQNHQAKGKVIPSSEEEDK